MMTKSPYERLTELGLVLPAPPPALAAYIPTATTPIGDGRVLLFIAGQVALRDDAPVMTGRVPDSVSLDDAVANARLCALNLLAQAEAAVGLGNIERVLQVTGYVQCADGFDRQPAVINGASELLVEVLGEVGRHTRAAVGVNALPLDVPVEVAATMVART